MKAYIEGVETIKTVDPNARILTTEPLINIASTSPPDDETDLLAAERHEEQFQVLEILSGQMCPELRGKPEYLDMIGVNFYYNNQWTHSGHAFIPWNENPKHPLWRPLHSLVEEVFEKYNRPIVLSEASHPGEDRAAWIRDIGNECIALLKSGLPLYGVCIYPLIDRPDWDRPTHWHHSGLWDIPDPNTLERKIHLESFQALTEFKRQLSCLLPISFGGDLFVES